MKLRTQKKFMLSSFTAILIASLGAGCNNSSNQTSTTTTNPSTTTTPTPPPIPANCASDPSSCSAITPENFVASLVALAQSGQINSAYANSKLAKEGSLQPGFFVIWDGATQTYMAVLPSTDQECSSNTAACANINPQTAALGFANAQTVPHTVATNSSSSGGTVVLTNGTTSSNGTVSTTSSASTTNGYELQGSFGTEYGIYGTDVNYTYSGVGGTILGIPLLSTSQTDDAGNTIYKDTYGDGTLYSDNSNQTHDTDLQQAQLRQTGFIKRAASVSANFQMDFGKAVQLTQLADQINQMKAQSQAFTSDDRTAITQTLSNIAGVSSDELTTAIAQQLQGNTQPTMDLLSKISTNLGMPSSASLSNQILPQLGLDLN